MLSLWKLRVGVESYYLAQIASGLDEYYTGAGEAPGVWTGTGSPLLGLDGEVAGDDLRAVLAGLAPDTGLTPNGTQLATSHPRRVPGFDLTFSVPKSVSVVYALGDPLVQAAVIDGCEAALAESMAWLEREACFVRRGTNNRENRPPIRPRFGTRRMVAEGFVAAQFPHRTSRLGDPHLHWHVLVANMARGIDGRWSGARRHRPVRGAADRRGDVPGGDAPRAHRPARCRVGADAQRLRRDRRQSRPELLREFSRARTDRRVARHHADVEGQPARTRRCSRPAPASGARRRRDSIEADWRPSAERSAGGRPQLEQLLAAAPGPVGAGQGASGSSSDVTWRAGEPTTVDHGR